MNFYYVLDEKHNYHKVEKIDKTDIVPQQPMPFLQTEWDVIYTVLEYYINENPEAHDRDRVLNSLVDLSGFMFGKNIVPYCYCYSENDPWGYTIKGYDDWVMLKGNEIWKWIRYPTVSVIIHLNGEGSLLQ